ncbi:MAG: DUF3160 domain-containing protein [Spirochaetales bacterium]|nr:DUF3160 domain-containing protein [Spirochaetales bacterium]
MKKKVFILFIIFLYFCISITIIAAQTVLYGDVNKDGKVDILDALKTAQYYVEQPDPNFDSKAAEVSGDGNIDIIDALLIAQYYVGLITIFPVETAEPTQSPTPEITPSPTSEEPVVYDYPYNWDVITSMYTITADAEQKLLTNGFVVLDYLKASSVALYYNSLSTRVDNGPFITTDALLHVFHLTYDHMLQTVEKEVFFQKLVTLLDLFHTETQYAYESIQPGMYVKEPARKLWIFAAVAEMLVHGETTLSGTGIAPIETEVNTYLSKVYAHTLEDTEDDYTQYEPRGHYTEDPLLEQYFRAMMWLQRRIFLTEKMEQLVSAGIMASIIANNAAIVSSWQELNNFITKLINECLGETPFTVHQALQETFGTEYETNGYMVLEDETNRTLFASAVDDYIFFMGQRMVIDSLVMAETLYDKVNYRKYPCALDMASTLLDSQAAYEEHADEMATFPDLRPVIDELRTLYNNKTADFWTQTIYNYQLYALRALSVTPAGNVPEFMKEPLWAREKLNTQLAYWSEMRHDNILYAMPVPTVVPGLTPTPAITPTPPPVGYVEPYPEFYERVSGMCTSTRDILDDAGYTAVHRTKFQQIATWADDFRDLAEKISDGIELTEGEKLAIRGWGSTLINYFKGFVKDDEPQCIADIFSDDGRVLHEAVGKLHPVIILYKEPGFPDYIGVVGYVMSYYEFYRENNDRINDEEWKVMLSENPPARPVWTDGFVSY